MAKTAEKDPIAQLDQPSAEVYEALRQRIVQTKTVRELMQAIDDDFKSDVQRLPEGVQRILRDTFSIQRDSLKGKVKAEDVANIALTITEPPDWPPSSKQFKQDDGTLKSSKFCVVKGVREDNGEHFELVTSAVRLVRHFEQAKVDSFPQRVMIYPESPEQMKARNAPSGNKPMWLLKRLAPVTAETRNDGIPF